MILKIDKVTGEVVDSYRSAYEAADDDRLLDPSTIYKACKAKSLTSFRWCYRFEKDYDPEEAYEEGKLYVPVLMHDLKTGSETVFDTARDAARCLGVTPNTVNAYAKKEKPVKGRYMVKRMTRMGEEHERQTDRPH